MWPLEGLRNAVETLESATQDNSSTAKTILARAGGGQDPSSSSRIAVRRPSGTPRPASCGRRSHASVGSQAKPPVCFAGGALGQWVTPGNAPWPVRPSAALAAVRAGAELGLPGPGIHRTRRPE